VLWGNGPAAPHSAAWALQHPEITSVFWSVLITAVFAPLALAAFRRRSRD
jgi:ABC-2 type transport system permease protein